MSGRKVRAPEKTLAVVDHNVPTTRPPAAQSRSGERASRSRRWRENARDFGIEYFDEFDRRQGIVHIIGPEQGFTLPGTTIVCGDSHTATHGAFGALAYGIGTSEVEHVLATQTLIQQKSKNMRVVGRRQAAARRHRQGHHPRHHRRDRHRRRHRPCDRICRRGDPRAVDGRAHDGLQHVDRGRRPRRHDRARREDLRLSEGPAEGAEGARLGTRRCAIGRRCAPTTARISTARSGSMPPSCRRSSPGAPAPSRSSSVDRPRADAGGDRRREQAPRRASARSTTWASRAARGSPTSRSTACSSARAPMGASRICARSPRVVERQARSTPSVNAMIVPGSGLVKEQAEAEGLDRIFIKAGFDWREPGCSMCLAMNPDKLDAGRALRLDLEPQFRRPAGLQAAARISSRRRWRRRPRSPDNSSTCANGIEPGRFPAWLMKPVSATLPPAAVTCSPLVNAWQWRMILCGRMCRWHQLGPAKTNTPTSLSKNLSRSIGPYTKRSRCPTRSRSSRRSPRRSSVHCRIARHAPATTLAQPPADNWQQEKRPAETAGLSLKSLRFTRRRSRTVRRRGR